MFSEGLPRWLIDKEYTCQCRRSRFHPWVGKTPWRKTWQPTPVFLSGESHEQRSLKATVHRVEKSRTQLKRLSTAREEHKLWSKVNLDLSPTSFPFSL